MVGLKDNQQQKMESKQFDSCDVDGMHISIFESLQLEGLCVVYLLYS